MGHADRERLLCPRGGGDGVLDLGYSIILNRVSVISQPRLYPDGLKEAYQSAGDDSLRLCQLKAHEVRA